MRYATVVAMILLGCSRIGTAVDATNDGASGDVIEAEDVIETKDAAAVDAVRTDTTVGDAYAETSVADASAEAAVPVELGVVGGLRGIAVGGGYVFVTSFDGAILRMPTTGGPAVKIAAPARPTYVAVDSAHVYWTDLAKPSMPGDVGRVPIAGGATQILAPALGQPNSCTLFGGRVYFAEPATTAGTFGRVGSVATTGGSVTWLAELQPDAYYVAVNATHVCWAAFSSIVCRKDGVVSPLTPVESGRVAALALDGSSAFYVYAGALRRVSLAGGAPVTLDTAIANPMGVADVAVDGAEVFWTVKGQLRKVSKSGGVGVVLATGSDPVGVALDASHVYWTSWPDNKVWRSPK